MKAQDLCLVLLPRIRLPLVVLNALVGAAGVAWLLARGDWVLVLVALLILLPATWLLGILLTPANRLAAPLQRLAEEEKRIPVAFFAFLQTLYSFVLITVWCVSAFGLCLGTLKHSGSDLPALLLAWAFAAGPWTYHASKEASDARETTLGALATQIACLALVVASGLFHLPNEQAYFVLGGVMLLAFVGATLLMLVVWFDFIERCEPSEL